MPYETPKGSGIYAITCIPTGKRYVGSAVNLASRWRIHRHHLNKGTHHSQKLLNVWRKYGEDNFSFSVLIQIDLKEYLVPEEQRFMDELRPELNMVLTAGSNLGNKATPEQRQRMCEAQKKASIKRAPLLRGLKRSDETRAKIKAARALQVMKSGHFFSAEHKRNLSLSKKGKSAWWNIGKVYSAEHRMKMSLAKLGKKRKPYTEETCRKISLGKLGKKRAPFSDEHRARLSKAITQLWKNRSCQTTQTP